MDIPRSVFASLIGLTLLSTTTCKTQGDVEPVPEHPGPITIQTETRESKQPPTKEPPTPPLLLVLPMGIFPVEEMKKVTGAIEDYYGWRTEILPAAKLPEAAWYAPRKRYRAEKLLDWIGPKLRTDADRIMGVTQQDISTTKGKHKDWGICGLAEIGGTASVVSTFRIKRRLERFKKKERRSIYLKRLAELAAHEFGHNLGLLHCPNLGCIMEDAKGTVSTFDHSKGKLCDRCQDLLRH